MLRNVCLGAILKQYYFRLMKVQFIFRLIQVEFALNY